MKARYASRCVLCNEDYEPGAEIGKFKGRWVHLSCRSTEIERLRVNLEGAIEIPMQDPTAGTGYGYTTGYSLNRARRGGPKGWAR